MNIHRLSVPTRGLVLNSGNIEARVSTHEAPN